MTLILYMVISITVGNVKDMKFYMLDTKKQKGFLTKRELLELLKQDGIEMTTRTLTYYADLCLIPKGIVKYIPGIRGSVSYFKENVFFMLKGIKKMTDQRAVKDIETGFVTVLSLKLKEVVKFKNLIYNYNEIELTKYLSIIRPELPPTYKLGYFAFINEQSKLVQVIIHYAHAEAGLFWESESYSLSDKPGHSIDWQPHLYTVKDLGKVVEIHIDIQREDSKKRIFYNEVIYSKRGIEIKERPGEINI